MKRQLTLRIGDEEFSVVAHREGDSIIIEREGEQFTATLVSESFVMAGGEKPDTDSAGRASQAKPAAAKTAPAAAAPKPASPAPKAQVPAATGGPGAINSPMVGVVKEVLVTAGASVNSGDRVMVLEAMKMDIDVVSHDSGTVAEVNVNAGDNVSEGQQLARIDVGGRA